MVEEDAVAGVHAVRLAVVLDNPKRVQLRHAIGAARIEGGGLRLRLFLRQAVELGGAGLVEFDRLLHAEDADGFEDAKGAKRVRVGGVLWRFKADLDMTLGGEVVDLIGLNLLHDADEVGAVHEVAIVQLQTNVVFVRILIEVVNAVRVELRRTALDAVDFVALVKQEFREVRAVLARDAGDECFSGRHGCENTSDLRAEGVSRPVLGSSPIGRSGRLGP